ncbi:MAG: SET domain-containing protein-lysine N-methyltransferase [Parcubacteria group bacterium]
MEFRKNMAKRMFSWMNPKLEVRETEKYGKGVFAKEDIEKNELLAIFGGYVLTLEEEEGLSGEFADTGVQIHDDFVLTSKEQKEDTDCFNHSCDPNAGYNGQIFLVAMENIEKEKEVTFDYAMVLHKAEKSREYKIKCLCGSEKCREYITENDWKIPELQKKYDGYFQYFLQEKINKLK